MIRSFVSIVVEGSRLGGGSVSSLVLRVSLLLWIPVVGGTTIALGFPLFGSMARNTLVLMLVVAHGRMAFSSIITIRALVHSMV